MKHCVIAPLLEDMCRNLGYDLRINNQGIKMKETCANKTCWVLSYVYLDEVNEIVLFSEKPEAEKLAFHLKGICTYYLRFKSKSEAISVAEELLRTSYSKFDNSLSLTEQYLY